MSDLVGRLRERADYYERWAADIRALNGASVDADHSDATARDLRAAATLLDSQVRGQPLSEADRPWAENAVITEQALTLGMGK